MLDYRLDPGEVATLAGIRKDRTKYDTGRKRSGKGGKHGTLLTAPILAIDGEGITDKDGAHRYVMLANSQGSYTEARYLTTEQCFEWLLALPKRHLIVGFSLNYDIVKWLRNLTESNLEYLWRNGWAKWGAYKIRWAPGKYFTLWHQDGRRVHIYDVFGFYQRSFVAALKEWNVGTEEQVARIEAMKASRSEFSQEDSAEMLAYCQEECKLLVELVGKLREALIEGGIPIEQWYGAGAIAAAIMKKEGVKEYLKRDVPEKYSEAVLSAYFGGRFELHRSGRHENVFTYDIRSAYPYILTGLPCLTHMTYREYDGYVVSEWALYQVQWSVPDGNMWGPFPFRIENTRQIVYPLSGMGWYHSAEVHAAMAMYGTSIHVIKSIVMLPACTDNNCDGKPFRFIPDYFRYRDELKQRGSQAQLTIKLGLNSLYGKTAQSVGRAEHKPPYQSFLWAGMITAGTRAMLLDAIGQNPDSILWTATDGIVSMEPLDLPCGRALGEWEDGRADWVFSVQSGVYQVCKDGDIQVRTRGFGKSETDFESIYQSFISDPMWGRYSYQTSRFVGIGSALMRKEFWSVVGRWIPMPREISFSNPKRWPVEPVLDGPVVVFEPPSAVAGQDASAPYTPKTSWIDMWEREDSDEAFELIVDMEQP